VARQMEATGGFITDFFQGKGAKRRPELKGKASTRDLNQVWAATLHLRTWFIGGEKLVEGGGKY